jgi:cell division septation protein DedD
VESQLKQRLIGAAVLVALAVIFLPMLVKGPAPDSGVSDVPLKVPDAPQGEYQTRDLPLVAPDEPAEGGAVGMQPAPASQPAAGETLPTVDTAAAGQGDAAMPAAANDQPMLPATAAGGDYAVHFGAYDSSVNADTVVARLRGARLPAFRESASINGKPAWRVRIGPYATRADAEIARLEAVRVGKQSGARVVALDAAEPAAVATASQPTPAASGQVVSEPLPPPAVAAKPVEKPAAKPAAAAEPPKPSAPAARGVGFAVQIGAFGNAAQAAAKRDQLRGAGFSAFTETVSTDKGTLTRVLAGPVVSRAEADQLRARVKTKTGIDGMVRAHP